MTEGATEVTARHHKVVLRFVRRLVRNEALAEDLTQETFLRAQRSGDVRRDKKNERSWLCAIALNLVRDHFRSVARTPVSAPDQAVLDQLPSDEDTERDALKAEMSACIGEFLLRLPSPQCEVVALHDEAGLSHAQIAAALDISVANSRVLLHRGRAALRETLEQNCVLSLDGDDIPCERRPSSQR